jgi:hypothetical protein
MADIWWEVSFNFKNVYQVAVSVVMVEMNVGCLWTKCEILLP